MPADKQGRPNSPAKTYRCVEPVPGKIRLLLDDRRIKEQEFAPADVAAVWQKATESARDAALSGLSVDSAIRLAYDAGHLGALAVLAVLGDLVAESEEIRGLRKGSMYDPTIAGEDERTLALSWIARTLPRLRQTLVTADPSLEERLVKSR